MEIFSILLRNKFIILFDGCIVFYQVNVHNWSVNENLDCFFIIYKAEINILAHYFWIFSDDYSIGCMLSHSVMSNSLWPFGL